LEAGEFPPDFFDEEGFFCEEDFCWWEEGFCVVGWPDLGAVVVLVPVRVLVVPVLVVVDVPVLVVVAGGHVSPTITAPAGSESPDSDTLCGTCSVSIVAPRSFTVTVQV
jgi:hypothetical protein